MPNIAAVLKEEIRRLARKEIKAHTGATRHAVAQYRRDIAQLKRLLQSQQKKLACFEAQERKLADQPAAEAGPLEGVRFSPRSVRAQRKRLGLSAEDYGRLVGVSGLTIYNWEHGKARPRKAQLALLIAVRGIGKRETIKKLTLIEQQAGKRRRRKKPRR
jgi:DNA-binding transcriptional regulator YiaG